MFWKCRLQDRAAALAKLMRLCHIQNTDSSLMKHIINLVLKSWLSMPSCFWRAVYSCLVCYSLFLFLPSRMSLYLKWGFLMPYFAAEGKITNLDINISSLGFFASIQCSLQFTSIILWKNGNCLLPITQNALRYIFHCELLWFIALFWTHCLSGESCYWSLLGVLLSSEVLGNEDICCS